jgi:hypothetical protein
MFLRMRLDVICLMGMHVCFRLLLFHACENFWVGKDSLHAGNLKAQPMLFSAFKDKRREECSVKGS